jgi:NAD(P)-dependent dehydrogenase (short-subunit alcohol dehydrogenase family)
VSLDGQVAIVTGGGGNIGRGVCRALARAGAQPIAVDLDPSGADAAVRGITCDVTDPDACAAAVDEVVRDFGGVDTLVNAAQGGTPGERNLAVRNPLEELTDDDMRYAFESGPIASFRMMRLCYPHFVARGGGAVVNFGSGFGTMGAPNCAAYATAKEAIRGLTKSAAVGWGSDNIRVNVISPAATADPSAAWIPEALAITPLHRIGDPERDIGTLVVYLASPDCFMTGRTLFADGGLGMFR